MTSSIGTRARSILSALSVRYMVCKNRHVLELILWDVIEGAKEDVAARVRRPDIRRERIELFAFN